MNPEKNELADEYFKDATENKTNIKNKRDIFHHYDGHNVKKYLLRPSDNKPYGYIKGYYKEPYYKKYKTTESEENDDNELIYKQEYNQYKEMSTNDPFDEAERFESYFKDPSFVKVMKKQTYLMGKLLDILEKEEMAKRDGEEKKSDFDMLLEEIEERKRKKNQTESCKTASPYAFQRITGKYVDLNFHV